MKNFLLVGALIVSINSYAEDNYTIPKENCKKAVDVVLNQDFELFKSISFPFESKHNDEARGLIERQHKKYTLKRYLGIHHFKIDRVKVINDAKNSEYQSVRRNHKKHGYKTELWVKYVFETVRADTKKQVKKSGECRFGLFDGKWYMVNLLR